MIIFSWSFLAILRKFGAKVYVQIKKETEK